VDGSNSRPSTNYSDVTIPVVFADALPALAGTMTTPIPLWCVNNTVMYNSSYNPWAGKIVVHYEGNLVANACNVTKASVWFYLLNASGYIRIAQAENEALVIIVLSYPINFLTLGMTYDAGLALLNAYNATVAPPATTTGTSTTASSSTTTASSSTTTASSSTASSSTTTALSSTTSVPTGGASRTFLSPLVVAIAWYAVGGSNRMG